MLQTSASWKLHNSMFGAVEQVTGPDPAAQYRRGLAIGEDRILATGAVVRSVADCRISASALAFAARDAGWEGHLGRNGQHRCRNPPCSASEWASLTPRCCQLSLPEFSSVAREWGLGGWNVPVASNRLRLWVLRQLKWFLA